MKSEKAISGQDGSNTNLRRKLTMNNYSTKQTNFNRGFQQRKPHPLTNQSPLTKVTKLVRHLIYSWLLFLLENRQIRLKDERQILPFILHKKTKQALVKTEGYSDDGIKNIESSVYRDVETMLDYETVQAVPPELFYDLQQSGETYLIEKTRAVPIPNFILNALLCESLEKEFTREQLLATGVFVLVEGYLRLDLDENLCRRGFMLPAIDKKNGLIVGLRVFRYPKDERPFILHARNFNLGVKK
jgi:hypothetical protein